MARPARWLAAVLMDTSNVEETVCTRMLWTQRQVHESASTGLNVCPAETKRKPIIQLLYQDMTQTQ